MAFSFKARMHDPDGRDEFCVEYPENGTWSVTRNGEPMWIAEDGVQTYSDGGTVIVRFDDHDPATDAAPDKTSTHTVRIDDEGRKVDVYTFFAYPLPGAHVLRILQLIFPSESGAPSLNGRALVLDEWWIGGRRYV